MTTSKPPEPGGFCPDCGTRLDAGPPTRRHCSNCGRTIYRNPIVGVAMVVRDEHGSVLIGRRSRGGYAGLWCIPCGYVEWGEDVREAASRELAEETGLSARATSVVAVHSNFHNVEQYTVGIWFAAEHVSGALAPADGELSELAYFDPATPPPLAFPTDALVLEQLARQPGGDESNH